MNTIRIVQDLTRADVFDLVTEGSAKDLLDDYEYWLRLRNGGYPETGSHFEFCEEVVTEWLNNNPWYQAGDNRIHMTAAVYNELMSYLEEEFERESSRQNL